jgi:hypothetical protein
MPDRQITVRAAAPADVAALRDLAAMTRRRSPRGRVLFAERDRMPVAAISLTTGAIVTDPHRASGDAVRSLRTRRWELLRQSGGSGRARGALHRVATLPA